MILNGLLFGLISTLHCAGMCGPLAMALPQHVKENKWKFAFAYQAGRIGVYVLIGSLVFTIGYSFSQFKMQQTASVVIGIAMLVFVAGSYVKLPFPVWFGKPFQKVLNKLQKVLQKGRGQSGFVFGVVNGLLPCGAIYIAAMYCASFTALWEAIAYMVLFGLGTMPVFIAAWFLVSKKIRFPRRNWMFIYKMLPILVGVLMILRGANLGIPYISPEISDNVNKIEVKNCCKH